VLARDGFERNFEPLVGSRLVVSVGRGRERLRRGAERERAESKTGD
jgi:hypothetical protein